MLRAHIAVVVALCCCVVVTGCTGDIVSGERPGDGDGGVIVDPPQEQGDDGGVIQPGPDAVPGSSCGDGSCDVGESCASCAADCGVCPPDCGDGICNGAETCENCSGDCGICNGTCGDNTCDGPGGETCNACDVDCNTTEVVCGNGECQEGESSTNCRADCGPSEWPLDWADIEQQVLDLINMHRAAGTDCPAGAKEPVGPLAMSPQLQLAARLHSWDMSTGAYMNHTSCNGRSPWVRAAAAGASATGETIGQGYPSAAAMVDGWMSSNGHCNILMTAGSTLVGIGHAREGASSWTGMFR